jgi:hypothetical protein
MHRAKTSLQRRVRTHHNLIIPSVPNVANVEEEVELEIDFVAAANTCPTSSASLV